MHACTLSHDSGASAEGYAPLPCNAFSFCPDERCWEPDMHKHGLGDCWLKFTEAPASPEVRSYLLPQNLGFRGSRH